MSAFWYGHTLGLKYLNNISHKINLQEWSFIEVETEEKTMF